MPLEIERKYLVASVPDVWPVPFKDISIYQTYLRPRDPKVSSERVRNSRPVGSERSMYTHTTKIRLADGVHEEHERKVSLSSYTRLLARGHSPTSVIQKTRRVFDWAGRTFELDIFDGSLYGVIILEVELPAMDTPVELPPFIEIVREVTSVADYTNAAMASRGRP